MNKRLLAFVKALYWPVAVVLVLVSVSGASMVFSQNLDRYARFEGETRLAMFVTVLCGLTLLRFKRHWLTPIPLIILCGLFAIAAIAPRYSDTIVCSLTNEPCFVISTFAGGSAPATRAAALTTSIGDPHAIATDRIGHIYFSGLNCVFRLDKNGSLERIAGNSRPGFSGDKILALKAQLFAPSGLAVSSTGDILIASGAHILEITSKGMLTTIAGNGSAGYSGDGGRAPKAQILWPEGLAVDAAGDLYIADLGNNRVRKVSRTGLITTVAGNGVGGYSGDGGQAIFAKLSRPADIALDQNGNLYISDSGNNRVRKVTPNGIITTVAGDGIEGYSGDGGAAVRAQLNSPDGLAVDTAGRLYIADSVNNRVRMVSPNGIISTFAGNGRVGFSGDGGPATHAQLSMPSGVALDDAGNLYIADDTNHRIRRVTPRGLITTVAGDGFGSSGEGGPALNAQIFDPPAVALDDIGNVYISGFSDNRIWKVSSDGVISTVAGTGVAGYSGDGGSATKAELDMPDGIAADRAGNLYIADTGNDRIRKVAPDGTITTVAGIGSPFYFGDGGLAIRAGLEPDSIALDQVGNLYVVDAIHSVVRKISLNGIITTVAGNGVMGYSGDGRLATKAQLNHPGEVVVDTAGDLYIADTFNHVIREVFSYGLIITVAGTGTRGYFGDGGPATKAQLLYPTGLALDRLGNLYIGDENRIRMVSRDGTMRTIAGNGQCCYSGDGSFARRARLALPFGLALDGAGDVYLADREALAVRLLRRVGSKTP